MLSILFVVVVTLFFHLTTIDQLHNHLRIVKYSKIVKFTCFIQQSNVYSNAIVLLIYFKVDSNKNIETEYDFKK